MANELQNKLNAILEDKNTNLKPENLKAGITCLGVEGTLEGGTTEGDVSTYVKEFTSEEEMRNSASTLEDGTICKIASGENYYSNLLDYTGAIKTIIIPTVIAPATKQSSASTPTVIYTNPMSATVLEIKSVMFSTNVIINISRNGEVTKLTYKYDDTVAGYVTTDITEDLTITYETVITCVDTSDGLSDVLANIKIPVLNYALTRVYEYKNEEFIEQKVFNDDIAYISEEDGVYPEAKRTGDISLIHTRERDIPIIVDTKYPQVHFVKTINKSDVEEGTYTYDNVIKYDEDVLDTPKELWQTITIEVTADKIIATCELCHAESILLDALVTQLVQGGMTYDNVEYTLNTETNIYEYDGNTNWYFGDYEEVAVSIVGIISTCTLVPLCIPSENWNNAFSILCNDKNILHGIYVYDEDKKRYNHMLYGFNTEPEHVLEGRKFYSDGTIVGTMKNNGELNYIPSDEEQIIPAGYTSGGKINGDSNLTPENIKSGVSIFGTKGSANIVKQFSSIEEMNASTGNSKGDIARLTSGDIIRAELDTPYDTLTFPKVFVLPESIESIQSAWGYGADETYMDNLSLSIYVSQGGDFLARVDYSNSTGTTVITYKSTDGITFVADEIQEDTTITFSKPITFRTSENDGWSDVLGYLAIVESPNFNGIYQYNGTSWDKVQEEIDGQILRQYETIEDMQSAEVNQDDLGMVIKPVGENIQQGQVFGGLLIFPKTVTLPDGVTFGFNELTWSSTTSGCSMAFTIGTSLMNIHIRLPEEEIINIDYTTEDGKIYTRTTPDEIIDTIVEFTASTWHEAISYFIQTYIKDVVEIYGYGDEGWQLILSNDTTSPETSNMIIEKGKEYVIEFNRTIDENINLADVAASQSLNITGTNGVNIVIGHNYFISYQDLMPAPDAVLIRNYMDASTIQILKDTFGESEVVVDNTDRGWKETIPHYSSGAAFNFHSIWTPHPITIDIASITENGTELDSLDLSAYSWLIKSVKQN